jgi:hypothetical protein
MLERFGMNAKQNFTIQALVTTLILNGVLLGVLYLMAGEPVQASGQLISLLAVGVVITLVLAGILAFLGRSALDAAESTRVARTPTVAPTPPVVTERPTPKVERTPATPKTIPAQTSQPAPTASALQMLAILQREGRLIDFLQEDLSLYEDEQIGAAVRSIHAGCKGALESHVKLEPVVTEDEGSTITVPVGFDAHAIRLTGDVAGEPPFQGVVRHRGWRAVKVELPQLMADQAAQSVVAAAEVEIERQGEVAIDYT